MKRSLKPKSNYTTSPLHGQPICSAYEDELKQATEQGRQRVALASLRKLRLVKGGEG